MPNLWLSTLLRCIFLSACVLLTSCLGPNETNSSSAITFHGILVYEGDHEVIDAEVQYSIREPDGRRWPFASGTLQTNDAGAFSVTPEAEWDPSQKAVMVLKYPSNGQRTLLGKSVNLSSFIKDGNHNLGTLELHPPTPIASGKITTPAGEPVIQAGVALSQENLSAQEISLYRLPPITMTFTDREGRFVLNAFQEYEDLLLTIDAEGYLEKRVKLSGGNLGLHVRLDPAWSVKGSIRVRDDGNPRITMRVIGTSPEQQVPRNFDSIDEGGEFSLNDNFPPGKYLLVADEITGFRHPFELGPEGGDSNLGHFDLVDKVEFVEIHAADQDGKSPWFLFAQDAEGNRQGSESDGTIAFIFYGDPPPLLIGGDDVQFARVDNPVDGMKVTLQPGLPVKFKLKPNPSLPPGWGVVATLVSREKEHPPASRFFSWAVDRGIIKAPFPGHYECELQAMDLVGAAENGAGGIYPNGVPITPPNNPLQVVIEDTTEPQIIYLELPQEQLDAMEKAIAERNS